MGVTHENLLNTIESDYPEKLEEGKDFAPPVPMEYLEELCGDNEQLWEYLDEMREYFYRYTVDVCEMERAKLGDIPENLEEIRERDGKRTSLHNAMIDSVKIFIRNLAAKGKDISWFGGLDKRGRTGYAYLALSMTFSELSKRVSQHE